MDFKISNSPFFGAGKICKSQALVFAEKKSDICVSATKNDSRVNTTR